jgi:putative phage-type endonuclease
MIQGSDEWFISKLGKVSSSRIKDIMAKTKSGISASRKNYMAELICERLTGQRTKHFTTKCMDDGKENEPFARAAYEAITCNIVKEVGFIDHPYIELSGASPDGLVSNDGLIEIKCPKTSTHLDTLLSKNIDDNYIYQMAWQMECTERKWCDFVSFDPRLPDDLQFFCKRVFLKDLPIDTIRNEVLKFLSELNEKIKLLRGEK